MFATPEHPLLERASTLAKNAAYISTACVPLREILNRSVHELDRCVQAVEALDTPHTLHNFVILHLFRHSIVLTDGVESLVSHACVDAAAPMLRSSLEANVGLMYLLNGQDERRKALAWLYVTNLDIIRSIRRRERTSAIDPVLASKLRRAYEQQLTTEPLLSIQSQYVAAQARQRRRKPQQARPKWYSLEDGPKNVKELVDVVLSEYDSESDLYETYRIFSGSIHATIGIEHSYRRFPNPTEIFPIRHVPPSHDNPLLFMRFGVFLMESTKRIVRRYLSSSEYSEYLDWGNQMLEQME